MASKDKKAPVIEKESSTSEIVRRFKANPGVFIGTVIVLILVTVSFVLVPAIVPRNVRGGGGGGGADLTFGYYDKIPITYVPGNYFAKYLERVSQYYRNSIDPNSFQYANIWRMSFEAAAVHTAILQEMKNNGYAIPVKTVDRMVAGLPQFQENGRFSSALYQSMPNNERLALWRQIQEELTKEAYVSDITELIPSAQEAEFIGKMSGRMRSFDMASFPVDDYPNTESIAYARENPNLFRSIHLSRISVSTNEREARQILNSVKDGTYTFEDAAKSYSTDSFTEKGGDMGLRLAYELEQDITNAEQLEKVLSLGKGEMSDVIHLDPSWAFFRVEEEMKSADFSDDTVMEKVRYYIRNFARGRMEDWAVAQAEAFIAHAKTDGFDHALGDLGKEKSSFGPLPINYGDVDIFASLQKGQIKELSNSSSDENFWKTIFSTVPNTLSQPIVQGANVLVFLPTEEIESEESSIQGIASTYSSYWLRYMSEQSLQAYILGSDKMENRFYDTYFRTFFPSGN